MNIVVEINYCVTSILLSSSSWDAIASDVESSEFGHAFVSQVERSKFGIAAKGNSWEINHLIQRGGKIALIQFRGLQQTFCSRSLSGKYYLFPWQMRLFVHDTTWY